MIEVKDLKFEIENEDGTIIKILNDINLRIQEGESVALMGANGSGKTTLARCLNGLLRPTSGEIRVDGLNPEDEAQLLEIRQKVGLVFQNPENQIASSTVEREIAFGLENIGLDISEMHAIVEQMLVQFDLIKYRKQPPHLLSGGEKQRLAIAAVMAMRPRYLILDEPTSLLDPVNCENILRLIQALHQSLVNQTNQSALTTILITQFPEETLIAQRLIIMSHGQIVLDGSPHDLFQQIEPLQAFGLGVPIEYEIAAVLTQKGWQREAIWELLNTVKD